MMKKFLCFGLLLLSLISSFAQTNSVRLAWCPSPDTNVTSYSISWGYGSFTNWHGDIYETNKPPCEAALVTRGTNMFRTYTQSLNVGNVLTCTISGLLSGQTYYFTSIAHADNGQASEFSNEIKYEVPMPQTNAVPTQPQDFKFHGFK